MCEVGDRDVLVLTREDVSKLKRIMAMSKGTGRRSSLSTKDASRLREMQTYCEQRSHCRRQTFANHFGAASGVGSFTSCRTMCDICLGIQHPPVAKKSTSKKRKGSTASANASTELVIIEEPTFNDDDIEYLEAGDNGSWKRIRGL